MWNELAKVIKESPKCRFSEDNRNSLFDCLTAAYFITNSYNNLQTYFDNYMSISHSVDYSIDRSYLYSLAKFEEHQDTPEEDKKEILKISELGHAIGDFDDNILDEKDVKLNEDRMRKCLILMKKGIEEILKRELIRRNTFEIIKNVKDKRAYLSHISDVPAGKREYDKVGYLIEFLESNIPQT